MNSITVISAAAPTAADLALTEKLLETLKKAGSFEPREETNKRVQVLRSLTATIKKWEIGVSAHLDGYQPSAQLLTFGSFRLGVHGPGGDIDTLLVAPRHISRSQFFGSFREMLEQDGNVCDLVAVPEAFVPIITMMYSGVEVDILFVRLDMKEIPKSLDLSDDSILKNLDEKDIRSLNGCRVAEQLLKLVPNQKEFALALRALKLWAKSHGICSNAMGFFGGVTWAILVAKTAQMYPNASASKLVQKVFYVFASWNWSWKCPVVLSTLPDLDTVWNPRRKEADRYHLMPILTPSFPQQNTTFNVSKSTAAVIQQEMKEAQEMCERIEGGKAEWKDLFEEINFFSRYKHFIALSMRAASEKDQKAYTGFLESRIRQLVMSLERNPSIKLAHVNTKSFVPRGNPTNKAIWFIGMEFAEYAKALDLTGTTDKFKVNLQNQAIQAKLPTVDIDIVYTKQSTLVTLISAKDLRRGRFLKPSSGGAKKRRMTDTGAPDANRVLQVRN